MNTQAPSNSWSNSSQPSPADRLAALARIERDEFLAALSPEQARELLYDWRGFNARPDQIAPEGDWDIWMPLAGRGWGKTRTGAEWVREQEAAGKRRIALVAETSADARDVMVEGPSGILSVYPPDERPVYEPTKRRLTWPSGAVATSFNATEPDQLRGPQFDCAWCDELAKWRYARQTWDMLQFGLRLGTSPQCLITTTPRPIELVKAIIAQEEGRAIITRGRTSDNAANLSSQFMERIRRRYEGTRLGRQELNAEVLADLPGALWVQRSLDAYRRATMPARDELTRILVAVDPAVTATEDSDENGIVVGGLLRDGTGVVLADESIKGSPMEWARRVVSLRKSNGADGIVIEVNQGGDMVAQTIRSVSPSENIIEVRATRGKHVRAEPIAALYEQGRVPHVGSLPELENQMTQMTVEGYQGDGSPDRCDALVWLFTELFPELAEPISAEPVRGIGISMV